MLIIDPNSWHARAIKYAWPKAELPADLCSYGKKLLWLPLMLWMQFAARLEMGRPVAVAYDSLLGLSTLLGLVMEAVAPFVPADDDMMGFTFGGLLIFFIVPLMWVLQGIWDVLGEVVDAVLPKPKPTGEQAPTSFCSLLARYARSLKERTCVPIQYIEMRPKEPPEPLP